MKKYFRLLLSFGLALSLILSLSITSFASLKDLMIVTDSNALMTLELDDSDYMLMSPRSSVGTVVNTISEAQVTVYCTDGSRAYNRVLEPELVNGRFKFSFTMPSGFESYWIRQVDFFIKDKSTGIDSLPPSGTYNLGFDFASDIGFTAPYRVDLYSAFEPDNAEAIGSAYQINNFSFSSGDLYIAPFAVNVRNNVQELRFNTAYYQSHNLKQFGGTFAINFAISNASGGVNLAGSNSSINDYEDGVSSSLSDLSSSVVSMTEDLSSAAENLEYISTSQNLIIQGIDNVVMHISDQLFAFWNQLFNLIHVPTMAKMDDIISAINNMDLEIEVNLDGLKSTINNMSTAIQNKLQSVTDIITGGFDNSCIEQNGNELDSSITEFEEAEQNVLESVNDSLNDFEFDADLSEYKNIVQVISDFLQELYDSSGGFKLVINLSLMLSVASIVIGVYRFKEGG